MIKISKKSQYGLRAMVQLAKNYKAGEICSVKTISEKENIPFEFLEKIVRQLADKGVVKSKKGLLGGYILSRPPKKISVRDVVSVLEENKKPVDCSFCNRKNNCSSKGVWGKLEATINKTLKNITLAELIK